ncbi:diacylglycerol kinase [Pseudooctadecabacter jejudonensis]|uniref:Diacylglycerol kinase n=1 Tax=Pseudooctadecabacter jejudonensis TaxID=1391910 RepID=A0A1Y5SL46_9RHOB|nr:diacylglycerol kinase [Pseudooctadecabacter jejudonensis]SLN43335.1 Diacylglycerol kinase [Pseudooctadecabacter jejudonensis]
MGLFEWLKTRIIWSCAGLRDAWRQEQSFRVWSWVNVVSAGLAFWLLSGAELALILALGLLILAVEMVNTAVERAVDLVSSERSELARQAKDAGSAGVMLAAIAAGVAWVVVLVT